VTPFLEKLVRGVGRHRGRQHIPDVRSVPCGEVNLSCAVLVKKTHPAEEIIR
jgi:hypothetical protein